MAQYIKQAHEVRDGIAHAGQVWFKHNVSSEWMPGIGYYNIDSSGVQYSVAHVSDYMLGTMWPDYIRHRTEGQGKPDDQDFNTAVHPKSLIELNHVDSKYIRDGRM